MLCYVCCMRPCHMLIQTIMMLNFLEASHFKINSCLCKLEGRTLPQHAFEQHIEGTRDKQVRCIDVSRIFTF